MFFHENTLHEGEHVFLLLRVILRANMQTFGSFQTLYFVIWSFSLLERKGKGAVQYSSKSLVNFLSINFRNSLFTLDSPDFSSCRYFWNTVHPRLLKC